MTPPTALMVECVVLGLLRRFRLGRIPLGAGAAAPAARLLDGIVLLSGATGDVTSRDRGTPVLNGPPIASPASSSRRRHPRAGLAFTRGSGQLVHGVSNEARHAHILLAEPGLPSQRALIDDCAASLEP